MIQIDGIPRSMYGREPPLVTFGGTEIAGVGGPSAGPSNPSAAAIDDVAAEAPAPATGWGERLRSRREYTMLKKVVRLLQDNRVDTDDGETAQRLQEINQNQSDSYPILKTILNGLFITTGVVLLVGVVVVIVYTSVVTPGSQNDIFRHVIHSHLQSNRDYQTDTDTNHEISDSDVDNYDGYDDTWTNTKVQDSQADEVDRPSSNGDGHHQPSDEQPLQSSSPSSSGGSPAEADGRTPKSAAVSGKGSGSGGSGGASSSTRPRRPLTKCRSVPVVYSGETVVRLGQICYQVPRNGS